MSLRPPQLQIIAGRNFTPGLRELIVGQGVLRQFQGAEIGKVVRMRGSEWTVVGEFASGDAHDSEMWADINVARTTFGRTGSSSVLAALDGPEGFDKLKRALSADPRLTMDVLREQDYFSGQTKQFRQTIGFLAGVVTIIMALGAVFAALNSMYAAVAARGKEIATLRAIGFGGLPVLISVMVEALLLALIGGLLGAMIAYVLFNNLSVSTLGQGFAQVVFNFKVTPELVVRGLIIALVIGMVGSFLPAIRAARLPVTATACMSNGPAGRSTSQARWQRPPHVARHQGRRDILQWRASAVHSAATSASGWSQKDTTKRAPRRGALAPSRRTSKPASRSAPAPLVAHRARGILRLPPPDVAGPPARWPCATRCARALVRWALRFHGPVST